MTTNSNRSHEIVTLSPGLLLIILSFGAGIFWAANFQVDEFFLWLPISLLATAAVIKNFFHTKWKNIHPVFFLTPLFFFIAALYVQPHFKNPADPNHIYNLISERQTVSLDGIMKEMPAVKYSPYGPKTKLLMQIRSVRFAPLEHMQKSKSVKATGLVQLHLKGLLPENLKPGDRFIAKAVVSRITTYSTPGTFNYKTYLANHSIWVNGWIESPVNIVELQNPAASVSFADFHRNRGRSGNYRI